MNYQDYKRAEQEAYKRMPRTRANSRHELKAKRHAVEIEFAQAKLNTALYLRSIEEAQARAEIAGCSGFDYSPDHDHVSWCLRVYGDVEEKQEHLSWLRDNPPVKPEPKPPVKRQPPLEGFITIYSGADNPMKRQPVTYTYYQHGLGVWKVADGCYSVTQIATGQLIGHSSKYADAKQAVDSLGPLMDWEREYKAGDVMPEAAATELRRLKTAGIL